VQFDPAVTKQASMGFPPGVAEKMVWVRELVYVRFYAMFLQRHRHVDCVL
jgi:hypothetical protein